MVNFLKMSRKNDEKLRILLWLLKTNCIDNQYGVKYF